MFHLTPQERMALICLLVIFCAGTLLSCVLKKDAHFLHWVKTVHQARSSFPIDLNHATAQQLDELPGIGLKTAQRIITYRQTHGRFHSVTDIRQVKGLSKKAIERIIPLLAVHSS